MPIDMRWNGSEDQRGSSNRFAQCNACSWYVAGVFVSGFESHTALFYLRFAVERGAGTTGVVKNVHRERVMGFEPGFVPLPCAASC
jgi:hypothetical protein